MKYLYTLRYGIAMLIVLVTATLYANAFSPDIYAPASVLSTGKWVKVSVPESGIYKITKSQLRKWGFSDPSAVRVYGYGGNRIPDRLDKSNYVDDLPLVQTVTTGAGDVIFYGVGPEKWSFSNKTPRYETNIYTVEGYYFVTEDANAIVPEITAKGMGQASNPATKFIHSIHYEQDLQSQGEAGYILVGENFKVQNDRKFTFSTPGIATPDTALLECGIVSKTAVSTTVNFSVNGAKLPTLSSHRISEIGSDTHVHGAYNIMPSEFKYSGDKAQVTISVDNINSTQGVWLDYINFSYKRDLQLPASGYLKFMTSSASLKLATSVSDVTIWDVSDPSKVTALNTSYSDGSIVWTNNDTGTRTYAVFSNNSVLPSPTYVSSVSNQNIHGMDTPEMVIFTLPEFKAQAERIASLHANSNSPLKVAVLEIGAVYNEFASGMADVSAMRKCLKMFYDRSSGQDSPLRYALILGRSTYDNRHLTSQFKGAGAYNTIPYWMGGLPTSQFSDNTAFGTDDFIAMLEDGSGKNLGLDNLCVGVGRIPMTTASEAKTYVDKLYQYVNEAAAGTWKNSFLFLADDGDNGEHMKHAEDMIAGLQDTPGQQNFVNKIYVDAYDIVGGVCKDGREEMYRLLKEGVMWWNYTGHANNHSWTAEGMLTFSDINSMYLRRIPIVMAFTCDFLRWDSNTLSGGEIMLFERNGGAIAMISATRPVYIPDNGYFATAMGKAVAKRDTDGRFGRIGDIYRHAKNSILSEGGNHISNPNRLRYVLMGDPAMMLPMPSNTIKIESIGGIAVTEENQVTVKALEQTDISGTIYNPAGEPITDFNGDITINIYDAERSMSTKGIRDDNVQKSFQQHGNLLYSGTAKVKDGKFSAKICMPGEVSDNFLPAFINAYACSDDKIKEAVGTNKDFYVYGYDESVEPDTEAPVIEYMVLNHESFTEGAIVNASPMVIAKIKDNIGINLSGAGIGHQMTLTLDGKFTFTDVANYYTPATDGSASGEIRYPLSDIASGNHEVLLRVWDTSSNSVSRNVNFIVDEEKAPTIFEVYTDVNPASTEVKFFIRHDRPDAHLTVTITVYDLLGHELWTTTSEGLSDMFISAPVTWNLTDATGRRLPRGIYLYRATVSSDKGDNFDSSTRRIAVTAQ